MTADKYTKAVLTVIAVSLLTIAVNGSGYVKTAQAELDSIDLYDIENYVSSIDSGVHKIASAISRLDLSCN